MERIRVKEPRAFRSSRASDRACTGDLRQVPHHCCRTKSGSFTCAWSSEELLDSARRPRSRFEIRKPHQLSGAGREIILYPGGIMRSRDPAGLWQRVFRQQGRMPRRSPARIIFTTIVEGAREPGAQSSVNACCAARRSRTSCSKRFSVQDRLPMAADILCCWRKNHAGTDDGGGLMSTTAAVAVPPLTSRDSRFTTRCSFKSSPRSFSASFLAWRRPILRFR